jgi:Uma2 family endonuclease
MNGTCWRAVPGEADDVGQAEVSSRRPGGCGSMTVLEAGHRGKERTMATVRGTRFETVAELLQQLGDIAPQRIRLQPPPGKATERDLIALHNRTDRLFELVDGVLVEKIMGFPESTLACDLIKILGIFLDQNDLGFLVGEAGTVRLMPGLVRIPDVAFVSWKQLPNKQRPTEPIPNLVPALAIEILSAGNTEKEMKRKLKEYFLAGVQVVWFIDPRDRTVAVYTAPDQWVVLTEQQTLDGGTVLPGLKLPVQAVFAKMPAQPQGARRRGAQQAGGRKPGKRRKDT